MTRIFDEADRCDCNVIHEDVVNHVRKRMPDDNAVMDLGDLFKVFADSTRLKILCALRNSEMCTCDLSALLGMTQ